MPLMQPNNVKVLDSLLQQFLPFARKRWGYDTTPDIRLAKDPDNAKKPLGKTAYYEPEQKRITVYVDGRHPKDVMRSVSHELVHHVQNLRGDLAGTQGVGEQGYAQNNDHLREMEREAYEQGNLCFRDWEDGIKSTHPDMYNEGITRRTRKVDRFTKRDNRINSRLMKKFGLVKESLDIRINESAESLPEWMYNYLEHQFEDEGASTHDANFDEIGAEWSAFEQAAHAALEELLGADGAEAFLSVDEDLYLLFQTIVESGRSFEDGDMDHLELGVDLVELTRELQAKLSNFADYTGGGSLNGAIHNAIDSAVGVEPVAIDRGAMEEPDDGFGSPAHYQERLRHEYPDDDDDDDDDDTDEYGTPKGYRRTDENSGVGDERLAQEVAKVSATVSAAMQARTAEVQGKEAATPSLDLISQAEGQLEDIHGYISGLSDLHEKLTNIFKKNPNYVKSLQEAGVSRKEFINSLKTKLKENYRELSKRNDLAEGSDPVGPVEAQKVAELLQNLGFTLTRGGLNSLIDFMQGLEQSGDLNATPDSRRGAIAEYGDHETQAQGGMVASNYSSDAELDQIADIVRTVIEGGGGLHDLKQPLEAEAFDVQATNRFVIVKTTNGDVGIASSKNVELSGDEELIDTPYGQLAVGRINQSMEEGSKASASGYQGWDSTSELGRAMSGMSKESFMEVIKDVQGQLGLSDEEMAQKIMKFTNSGMAEGFRDSPEEKEMTSKMSNKEFSDYHTRDKHLAPDLKGDMGPIPGMEGPFQFRSGAVLYWDNKVGKYYDRGKDMYLDNEEAGRLTMESTDGDSLQTGDEVEIVGSVNAGKTGVVKEPMAGGAVIEIEGGKLVKVKSEYIEKAGYMSGEETGEAWAENIVNGIHKSLQEYGYDDEYDDEDPEMASLEREFPWLADKKGSKGPAVDPDAEAAAAADAAAAGEFEVAPEEEEEEPPQVMKETHDENVFAMGDAIVDALGHEGALENMYKGMGKDEGKENMEYIARHYEVGIPDIGADPGMEAYWEAFDQLKAAMGEESLFDNTIKAMDTQTATDLFEFIMTNYEIRMDDDEIEDFDPNKHWQESEDLYDKRNKRLTESLWKWAVK